MLSQYQINQRQKGLRRDRLILETIEERQALDADQVRAMFFRMEYGQRKAQERLQKLFAAGRVSRDESVKPFVYFAGERPAQLAHRLGVNWARLWIEQSCSSWERVHSFNYEQDYGQLRTDGFAAVKNTVSGRLRFLFLEMDRGTNSFDKISKYCKLYESGKYASWWWVELTERFPPVLIVTTSAARKKRILDLIKKENSSGLEFRVRLLDEIREEVLHGSD